MVSFSRTWEIKSKVGLYGSGNERLREELRLQRVLRNSVPWSMSSRQRARDGLTPASRLVFASLGQTLLVSKVFSWH